MGILKKLTPKKVVPDAVKPYLPKALTSTVLPVATEPDTPAVDPDDEPTVFTTFMIIYYGFFE